MSQSKTFQFNLNLGAFLQPTGAYAKIYGIRESSPEELGATTIDHLSFDYSLPTDGFSYFYIVVKITSYSFQGQDHGAGSRQLQYLAVFSKDDDIVTVLTGI